MIFKVLSWCSEQAKDEYTKAALTLSVLVIVIGWWKLRKHSRQEKVLSPPGPWGLPLVGNLPFLDPSLHSCLAQLSLKYGSIMKIQLGRRPCVVLSSAEAAKEVLKDHDADFADRDVPATAFCVYGAANIAFAPYGEHWRMMRKVCVRELLSHGNLEALYGLRRAGVEDMVITVRSKIGSPIDIGELSVLSMFNIITSMMWGNTLDREERLRVSTKFREVAQKMVGLLGEANISDFFPMLSKFDIQGKERRMKEVVQWFDQIFEFVIDKRRKMETLAEYDEEVQKDFLQVLLRLIDEGDQKTPFSITHLKALFVDMTVAGTKTISVSVEWAMAELLNQPEMFKKAQDELDRVVGKNNVVEESHLSKLPYLDAIIKEVMRLHPVGPLLIPRCARESCVIGGYLIPKGAKIFVNVWAIQRDPTYWTDPLKFKPERFLYSSNVWDYNGNDFRYIPFGSGRRICVGIPLAEKLVSYLLASLLHSFSWKLPEGTELDLTAQFGLELKKQIPLCAIPSPRLREEF
ncbi:hypothetical protein ACHQM5_001234 [Ranunculus cassubicifolius]